MTENCTIEKIIFEKKLTWISINNPDEKAMKFLHKKYKFHHLDLEDCLSEIERPKIDEYENYLFVVLQIPGNAKRKKYIVNSEIDIFIGQNFVITLHKDNNTVDNLFRDCKKRKKVREEYMGKGSGYLLYMIINDLFESRFPVMDALSRQITQMEGEVFDRDFSHDYLKDILALKKDIINFRRIIMPQRSIIAQLEHKNKKFLPEKLDVYFDDIVDKIERMWNNLENLKELVASLQETNESIISHNTNNVIKILTLISVVMLPLTFVTGFYGMNVVGLPLAEHSSATFYVSGVILAVAISMIAYFRYKKWL
jgi:magnesium transporter